MSKTFEELVLLSPDEFTNLSEKEYKQAYITMVSKLGEYIKDNFDVFKGYLELCQKINCVDVSASDVYDSIDETLNVFHSKKEDITLERFSEELEYTLDYLRNYYYSE